MTFRLGASISHFEGNGKVKSVVLDSGEYIEADFVVIGVGVKPATDFLHGIDLQTDGSVKVDQYFCAGKDVYAAGDIALFPDWRTGEYIRIEHWRSAEQQRCIAAHTMVGKKTPYTRIPFFWTNQVGLNLRYVGHVNDWDELIIHGDVPSKKIIVYYIKNNHVLATVGNKHAQEMAAIEELMRLKKMPTVKALKQNTVNLLQFVQ